MLAAGTTQDKLETQLANALPTVAIEKIKPPRIDATSKKPAKHLQQMQRCCPRHRAQECTFPHKQLTKKMNIYGVTMIPASNSHPQNIANRADLVSNLAALGLGLRG